MSGAKRFNFVGEVGVEDDVYPVESPDGLYVTYADYAAREEAYRASASALVRDIESLYVRFRDCDDDRNAAEARALAAEAAIDRLGGDGIGVQVRYNDDGTLDEVVGWGAFHLEQMDTARWFLNLGPHGVYFNKGRIVQIGINEHPHGPHDGPALRAAIAALSPTTTGENTGGDSDG